MITITPSEEERTKDVYTPSGYIKIRKAPQEYITSKHWGGAIGNCELYKIEGYEDNGDDVYVCPYCGRDGHIYMQMRSHITSCSRRFNRETQYYSGVRTWIEKRKKNGMLF